MKKKEKMIYKTLAVVIQTTDDKIYQVALTPEMADSLQSDLTSYFEGGKIKILPNEIVGIELEKKILT